MKADDRSWWLKLLIMSKSQSITQEYRLHFILNSMQLFPESMVRIDWVGAEQWWRPCSGRLVMPDTALRHCGCTGGALGASNGLC